MLCTRIVFSFCFDIQNNICTQPVLNLYFSGNSMNCGLTDSRMRASDTDLLVLTWKSQQVVQNFTFTFGTFLGSAFPSGHALGTFWGPFLVSVWNGLRNYLSSCCFSSVETKAWSARGAVLSWCKTNMAEGFTWSKSVTVAMWRFNIGLLDAKPCRDECAMQTVGKW